MNRPPNQLIFFIIILDDKNDRFLFTAPAAVDGGGILWRLILSSFGKTLTNQENSSLFAFNQEKLLVSRKKKYLCRKKTVVFFIHPLFGYGLHGLTQVRLKIRLSLFF
jgi:hypothetical protein